MPAPSSAAAPRRRPRRLPAGAATGCPARRRRSGSAPRTFAWGDADLRDGHPQRHPRLVLRRRPASAGGARPGGSRPRSAAGPGRMVDEGADLLDVGGESTRPGHARGRRRRARSPGSCPVVARAPRGPARHADQHRHDEAGGRRGGARRRRGPAQRRLGRGADDELAPARRRARRPDRPDAQPGRAALREPRRGGRRRPAARRSSGRSPPASPGTRSSSIPGSGSARPPTTTSPSCATSRRCACWAGRSCSARRASRPSARSSTCRPTSGSRRPSRRPPSGSPPGSTSSASTTSAPNVRAARMADAIVRGAPASTDRHRRRERAERPDRAPQHPLPGPPRRPTSTSCAAPQPFEVDVELVLDLQPAGIDDDLAQSVDYAARLRRRPRRSSSRRSFRLLEALAEAIATSILAAFPVDEVGVRVRKPAVQLGGPLDYAGVEIWRRRSAARPDGGRPTARSRSRPAAPT